MKQTIQNKIIQGLIDRGFVETQNKSRKYRAFEKEGIKGFLFVGKNGALRRGLTATKSLSWTNNKFYRDLLEEE